jgi:hypothetical protein
MFETLSRRVYVFLVAILENTKSIGGIEILILTRARMQKNWKCKKLSRRVYVFLVPIRRGIGAFLHKAEAMMKESIYLTDQKVISCSA